MVKLALDLSPTPKLHQAFEELISSNPLIADLASFFHVRRDIFYSPPVNFIPLGLPVVDYPLAGEHLAIMTQAEQITLARMPRIGDDFGPFIRVVERDAGFGLLGIRTLEEGFPLSDMRVEMYKTAVPHRLQDFISGRGEYNFDIIHSPEAKKKIVPFFGYYGLALNFDGEEPVVRVKGQIISYHSATGFMLDALALRLALIQHIIHEKLGRCASQGCGSSFEPHNTNLLSVFDYDTILLGRVSEDLLARDRYWAEMTIRLFAKYLFRMNGMYLPAGSLSRYQTIRDSLKEGHFEPLERFLILSKFRFPDVMGPLPQAAWNDGREYMGFADTVEG